MALSVEELWKASSPELATAYYEARRAFAEKKFVRDTQRARLEWQRAKAFISASGRGVSDRNSIVESSEEFGRKGQEVREMTRELDLLRADIALIALIIRMRSGVIPGEAGAPTEAEETTQDAEQAS